MDFSESYDLDWIKVIGGNATDNINEIVAVTDGYCIVGDTNSTSGDLKNMKGGTYDSYIAKYDFEGNLKWLDVWGGTGQDYFKGATSTSDGGCIAVGYSTSAG